MKEEDGLTIRMIELYRQTGEATGYWAHYFLREVRRRGGTAVAKRLLRPSRGISKGFHRLASVGRADFSVEMLVLRDEFRGRFSAAELEEAQRRLDDLPSAAFPVRRDVEELHAEDLSRDRKYVEGAVKRVKVNAYERNRAARAACLRYYEARCIVCDLDFEDRYGEIGRGFVHVHHLRPIGLLSRSYKLNPKRDLVPVCPNCHAMLHSQEPPLEPADLRARLRTLGRNSGMARESPTRLNRAGRRA
jgi:5-methylcytosine-specific restriction enzyme A